MQIFFKTRDAIISNKKSIKSITYASFSERSKIIHSRKYNDTVRTGF